MTCFGLKQGQDFKISAAHPQQEFPGLLSPHQATPPPPDTHTHTRCTLTVKASRTVFTLTLQ